MDTLRAYILAVCRGDGDVVEMGQGQTNTKSSQTPPYRLNDFLSPEGSKSIWRLVTTAKWNK